MCHATAGMYKPIAMGEEATITTMTGVKVRKAL
jgi:hypothetical protein